ncbi:MAG: chromosome segregation protein SMC [Alphaproteobacteria bacterium]|nr:chromosome segregation protein SMC [Alphaproteobacteria bacterium]
MVTFKRLRLSGFKSFVEPTELDIGQGLTGIVGPNGCGKSNLVEALRWVMGENSPKRMRSSGMNDVIFAGTEKRPQRSTAEVVLSLDNTDRTAPAEINDSDDLEVSRKIERDVGSTYKVNGKNVRMRDVQLLFADSSIGAHSPALVSQGRVADMINAKPQQRRMVLEEAAGISGLHARRHEAELKLRAAENNLTRVEDVIGAMTGQLDSLKKQARQANRYRNLSDHIASAEGGVLYLRWQQSGTAVEKALEAFNAAEDIVREKTSEVTTLTTQQTEAAAVLPELRQKEAEAAAALQSLKLAYGSLETEARQVQEETEKSESLKGQYSADIAHENTQKEESATNIARLETEQAELVSQGENQQDRENNALTARDEKRANVEARETEVTALTETVAAQDAERNTIERQIGDMERRLQNLAERRERFEREHADIVANTPARAELETVAAAVTTAEEVYAAATTELDTAESARADAETRVSETTERLQTAQKDHAQLTAEADALRRVLKNAQEGFKPVIEETTVESGLEKALAVALGDDLQATLDGDAPIYWRDMPEFDSTAALPAGTKPLSGFVNAPRALSRVLSQIGVVDTVADAESLMPALRPGQCLVTTDGGAWRWDGLVVTPDAENAAAVRLQQKNRLADVETEIIAAETALETARNDAATAKERRSEIIDAIAAARSAARSAEEELNSLRRRHSSLTNQLSEVTAKLSSLSTSIETAAAEITETTETLETARRTFAELPETAQSRAKITELKTTLSAERQELATLEATYAEIRREGENRARRLAQITDERTGWTARAERGTTRIAELEGRIAELDETLETLASRPAEIEKEKQDLMTRITEAETSRTTAADALINAETSANDLQRDLRAVESALSDARESRAMAQAGVSTSQHTQTSVEEQIQEKFDCTPEALIEKLSLEVEKLPELEALQSKLDRLLRERDNMGPVNLRAEVEAQEITDKMDEMTTERDDLIAAIDKLREGIAKLNKEARERLLAAFDTVNGHFQKLFTRLFNGGEAHLKMIDAEDPLQAGLEIFAQPPGKKMQSLSLLSGGEQTLTSIALIFGMFLTNPAPICVLDEVDAPLDESNVDRFCTLLEDLSKESDNFTRFIVITHHRMTMARMDRLYGVTMGEKGVSQLVSVDLTQHALELEAA